MPVSCKTPQTRRPSTASVEVLPDIAHPTAAQWSSLDSADAELLQRVLNEPVSYMKSRMFHRPGAEDTLFCGEPAEGIDPARREAPGKARSLDREQLLFLRFNYARMRHARVLQEHAGRRIPLGRIRELLLWVRRARSMRDYIVECNAPLVLAMIRRTRPMSADFDELLSEGNLALLRAVDKFDCSRGFRFSTYACRAILKSFVRASRKCSRYRNRFPVQYEPDLEQSDGNDTRHQDAVDGCVETLQKIVEQNGAELTRQEQLVVAARFQLQTEGIPPAVRTLEQVGNLIGVTKERVRQIQNGALRKLRQALEEDYLDPISVSADF